MSKADRIFKENIKEIILSGTATNGKNTRAHWDDGSPAYTTKIFGVINRYDLREEFPAITVRKTALKSAWDEILWIYQKKSNNVKDLSSHIWDQWADENGSIGTCYGDVVGRKFIYKNEEVDQIYYVLKQLKEDPFSRRIMTNLYQYEYLHSGALDPCAYSMTYNVTTSEDGLVLNAILNQRSQDFIVANNWNVAQYAILLMALAQVNNMIPGELIHVISDCHIYDRHKPIALELLSRPEHPAPKVWLNPEIKDFYMFTKDDLYVEDYITEPQITIPVAI